MKGYSLKNELESRKEKLLTLLKEKDLDGILLSSSAQIDQRGNLRYFLNYYVAVYEEYALLTKEGKYIFIAHDGLSAKTASMVEIIDKAVIIPTYAYAGEYISEILKKLHIQKLGIASFRSINTETFSQMQASYSDLQMYDLYNDVMQMRKIKSPYEYERIKEAVHLNDSCFEHFVELLCPGIEDIKALRQAQKFGEELGTEDQYWMMSSGPIPRNNYHALTKRSPRTLCEGDYITIVLEHSSQDGYWGETYNIVSLGSPRHDIQMAYQCLADLHKELIHLLKPGNKIHDIVTYVQSRLIEKGYRKPRKLGDPMVSIGHGQGLDAFEPPLIVEGSMEVLEANTQVNIHPSIVFADGTSLSLCVCYFIHTDYVERLTRLSDEIYQR